MNILFNMLAGLASFNYQEKYIIYGTIDEYELPSSMLEEVITYINAILLNNPELSKPLNNNQLEEIKQMFQEFKRLHLLIPYFEVSKEELILRDRYWVEMRNIAIKYLENNGFDLKEWEKQNIN